MTQPPGVGEPGGPRGIDTSPAGPPAPEQPSNPFQAPPPGYTPPAGGPPAGGPQGPPPAYGGPAAPPAYGPPPGWAPPPKTNGLAIASLVLALVGLGLIGLILGIVALVQIPRRGQKGTVLAWVGIVLSVFSMIIAAAVGYGLYSFVQDNQAQRDSNGHVTATADAGTAELRKGDCVTGLSESTDAAPKVVPCEGKYEAEVFDTFELPAGAYPGTAPLQKQADEGCSKRFEASGAVADEKTEIWYLYPSTKLAWQLGDRTIVCLTAPSGP